MHVKRPQLFLALLALGLAAPALLAPHVRADDAAVADALVEIAGAPPAPGSDQAKIDLAIVLWEQDRRTPADVVRAASEEKLALPAFAEALGGVDPERLPKLQALLALAQTDAKAVTVPMKKRFDRPRPYAAEPRVQPAIAREQSAAFPSGHATRGVLFAALLAEVAPERKEPLLARGRQVGVDRVIGGVHWPSDVAAGQRLGQALAARLVPTAPYQDAIRAAQAEWAGPAGRAAAR